MTNSLSKSLAELADSVSYAEHTRSEYYTIGSIRVRFSDHMAEEMDCELAVFCNRVGKQNVYIVIPMVGKFKEVQWFGKVPDVIEFIKRFESIARLLLKAPTHNNNKQDRVLSNALSVIGDMPSSGSEEVSLQEWRKQLKFVYGCKAFNDILDEIFTINRSQEMINKIKKIGPLTTELRGQVLEEMLTKLKQK